MPLVLLLALQAAAPPASAILDVDFDLARYSEVELGLGRGACNRADPSAIVVCARRGRGDYPLAQMARIFEPRHLVAETGLTGNLSGNVHLERGDIATDRGAVPQRIMIGLRLPF